jgi:hypothetical protein
VIAHEENIDLLTAKDVQRILRVSLPFVYKLAERGQMPCVRWECPGEGKVKARSMVRFRRSDVSAFIKKHYTTA